MRRCLPLLALLFSATVLAQEAAVRISPSGNAYFAGGSYRVLKPIEADLIAAGGRVSVEAPVGADAALAGGSVDVRAPISEDLRVAGGAVTLLNAIGSDLIAAGGNVRVEDSVRVGGAAWLAGGDLRLAGTIGQDALLYGDSIVIAADIAGDARVAGQRIELAPQARIGGDFYYTSPRPPHGLETARIDGRVIRLDSPGRGRESRTGPGIGWLLPVFLASMLLFGVILHLLFPYAITGVTRTLRRHPWRSLALGFALLFTVPPLAVLAMATLIGLPLGFAMLLLYPLLLLLGYLATAFFLSRRGAALGGRGDDLGVGRQALFLALALLVLGLLLAVPFLGPLVFLLATVIGAGGIATWAWFAMHPGRHSS